MVAGISLIMKICYIGLRHGSSSTNTRAIRILNLMLNIAGKHKTHHA